MNILLVEDEDPKRRHIASFVSAIAQNCKLSTARSVRSALDSIEHTLPDLILLDMSLPTFDVGANEGGGRPQGFGGLELMRILELEEVNCPVIVLTGYDAFTKQGGEVSLAALNVQLATAHPHIFKGLLHYNSAYGDWQKRLKALLTEIGAISQ